MFASGQRKLGQTKHQIMKQFPFCALARLPQINNISQPNIDSDTCLIWAYKKTYELGVDSAMCGYGANVL